MQEVEEGRGDSSPTLKMWQRFSRARSRSSLVFLILCSLSSDSASFPSSRPAVRRHQREPPLLLLLAAEFSSILLAVWRAWATTCTSFITCSTTTAQQPFKGKMFFLQLQYLEGPLGEK